MLLMFVGWEGVGLCSYLLIGFYFLKKSLPTPAKKPSSSIASVTPVSSSAFSSPPDSGHHPLYYSRFAGFRGYSGIFRL